MPVTITRRSALLTAAVAPLSACSLVEPGADHAPEPADPDQTTRQLAADAERGIIARYQATAQAHPDLETALGAFIARHERHLEEVLATAPSAPDSQSPNGATATNITAGDVPASRTDALAALREAESTSAADRTEDSVASYDYELARVFASVAACESAHEQLLGDLT